MADSIEQAWAAYCGEGGEERFSRFYAQTQPLVWSICMRLLRQREDALDAFQATYCRLIARAESPEGAGPDEIELHIYRLAVREAHNLRKRRKRRTQREVAVENPPTVIDPALTAFDQIAQAQAREKIELLIALLPDPLRDPLLMHYFHGKSQAEIAQIFGCSKMTISRRIAQGLEKLEPLARRAGLRDALRVFVGGGISLTLLNPPSGIAAKGIYTAAKAALSAGGLAAGTGLFQTTLLGVSIMKSNMALVLILMLALVGVGGMFASSRGGKTAGASTESELVTALKQAEGMLIAAKILYEVETVMSQAGHLDENYDGAGNVVTTGAENSLVRVEYIWEGEKIRSTIQKQKAEIYVPVVVQVFDGIVSRIYDIPNHRASIEKGGASIVHNPRSQFGLRDLNGTPWAVLIERSPSFSIEKHTEKGRELLLAILQDPQGLKTDKLWIDPSLGFRVIKEEVFEEGGQRALLIDYSDFRKIGETWIPYHSVREILLPKEYRGKTTSTILEATVSPAIGPDTFTVDFPSGTVVNDTIQQKIYTVKP